MIRQLESFPKEFDECWLVGKEISENTKDRG